MNITEAEFDALEYVAVVGHVATHDGPHISSLLERLRPFAKRETDSPQPVAWAVLGDGFEYVSLMPEMCVAWAGENGGRTVPLYATPDAASTPGEGTSQGWCTLTTYERDVLQRMLKYNERLAGDATEPRGWMAMQADTDADILRALIGRLT